jgi:BirA family biotin operon repressor/biotin-[acetyl-CoA-carboxylase] ligase
LAVQGARGVDRGDIAVDLLRAFHERELRWRDASGALDASGLREEYRARCATLGAQVEVALPEGATLRGTAADIDPAGQLIVDLGDGRRETISAGDVVHVR